MTHGHHLGRAGARDARSRWRHARSALTRSLAVQAGLPETLEDILSSILNISSEGIIVADQDQRILLFSKGAEAIFGYSASEALGQSIDMLIPHDSRQAHRQRVQGFAAGAILSRRMGNRQDITGLTKDGRLTPIEVGLSKVTTRSGMIYTAIIRDISDRVATEAALNQAVSDAIAANAAKSAFLAAMSHEVRTPLNGVLGMAQAMARDPLSPKQAERLDIIRRSGESLLGTLNDMLDLSKIEAGKLEIEMLEFDLGALIEGACETFSALAAQKGLTFEARIAPQAQGAYVGDPLRLRQVLNNLISNAVKFTERGRVEVAVDREDGRLIIAVRDTGMGISPEIRDRLFSKFEQGDLAVTRRHGGTGLGLAICQDLVRLMGGDIAACDTPVGAGATFTVRLPLEHVGEVPPLPDLAEEAVEAAHAASVRLLVAEDNRANQLVIDTLLRQAGIAPVIVPDGRAAVSAWEDQPWDLILMDVQMPEMDGPTATSIIRRRELDRGQARTPILALTANAMDHQLAEYRQAGMDGLVAKPIEVDKLFAAIFDVINARSAA
ncbi:PAS domain S-box protein [Brevundimonas naejangsanensis]|uniref:histidine kinase n=1 Tax=Brevundimonas naejangsanensis TaxID=588932 RepID=A0A494RKP7_9CAUL|nr:PAS domain-containing hybrid sensor histidine kinase/response regulator [Brevundimonas naejangsanensis]AYG95130.1 PAS domain S-box protein [Brevundimonas naejangsanensis]